MKISNCCNADGNTLTGYRFQSNDILYIDMELCPKCGEHCEYVEETDLNEEVLEVGKKVSFKYNGRKVIGIVYSINGKSIAITLHTDYKGKNEEWFSGELKRFFKGGMKNIKIIGE